MIVCYICHRELPPSSPSQVTDDAVIGDELCAECSAHKLEHYIIAEVTGGMTWRETTGRFLVLDETAIRSVLRGTGSVLLGVLAEHCARAPAHVFDKLLEDVVGTSEGTAYGPN